MSGGVDLWELENAVCGEGYGVVCGVDEAGRGPLAGPVCAAAVILPRGLVIEGLNDSKKLTEKRRESLYGDSRAGREIDLALIDGNRSAGIEYPSRTVVKGDSLCASIAAASVLAKVTRDRYMTELDARYPGYGFAKHKGYGTKAHYAAIRELGASPVHRPSFLRKMH